METKGQTAMSLSLEKLSLLKTSSSFSTILFFSRISAKRCSVCWMDFCWEEREFKNPTYETRYHFSRDPSAHQHHIPQPEETNIAGKRPHT